MSNHLKLQSVQELYLQSHSLRFAAEPLLAGAKRNWMHTIALLLILYGCCCIFKHISIHLSSASKSKHTAELILL